VVGAWYVHGAVAIPIGRREMEREEGNGEGGGRQRGRREMVRGVEKGGGGERVVSGE
jgi:hypothetical protein